jgi:hypothetical protein
VDPVREERWGEARRESGDVGDGEGDVCPSLLDDERKEEIQTKERQGEEKIKLKFKFYPFPFE